MLALQNRLLPEQTDLNDIFGQKMSCKNNFRRNFIHLHRQSKRQQKFAGQHAKFNGKTMKFWRFIKESCGRKMTKQENHVC